MARKYKDKYLHDKFLGDFFSLGFRVESLNLRD